VSQPENETECEGVGALVAHETQAAGKKSAVQRAIYPLLYIMYISLR
jgi:hypothetical protein